MSRLLKHYSKCKTGFICCDIQEKLITKVKNFSHCVFVANRFSQLHDILGPEHSLFIVTEQFPQGVGPTSKDIKLPKDAHLFAKTQLCLLLPEVLKLLEEEKVEQVVLWGNETQACILQSAAGLVALNKRVAIVADGTGSQSETEHKYAIELASSWAKDGCYVSTSESVVLQLLKDASDPKFKAAAQLLKEKPPVIEV